MMLARTKPPVALLLLALAASACREKNLDASDCRLILAISTPRPGDRVVGDLPIVLRGSACLDPSKAITAQLAEAATTLERSEGGPCTGVLDSRATAGDGAADLVITAFDRASRRVTATVPVQLANHYDVLGSSSASVVRANDSVTVSCQLFAGDGSEVTGESFDIMLEPMPGSVTATDTSVTFASTRVGTYAARCAARNGDIWQEEPTLIEIIAAEVAIVDTMVTPLQFAAGGAATATCTMHDPYGNLLLEPGPDASAAITELSAAALGDGRHTISATAVGSYTVACGASGVIDATPVTVKVVPAAPATVETTAVGTARAGDPIAVDCIVRDGYGNPIDNEPIGLAVTHSGGAPATQSGLTITGNSFSVEVAGSYDVACSAPAAGLVDASPASITVTANLPASLSAHLDGLACNGATLTLITAASDAWGNAVANPAVTLAAPADDLFVNNGDGTLTLSTGVPFSFEVWLDEPSYANIPVAPAIISVVPDATPPTLVVTEPARAELRLSGSYADEPLAVVGSASDASGLVTLLVDGVAVTVATDDSFATTISSRAGVTPFEISAVDPCGNAAQRVQAVLRAPDFYPAVTTVDPTAAITTGFAMHLGPGAVDDSDRADLDDLATLGERLASSIDLNAALPVNSVLMSSNPSCPCAFTGVASYTVKRRNVSISANGPSVVSLRAVDGGLRMIYRLTSISVPLNIAGAVKVCAPVGCTVSSTNYSVNVTVTATTFEVTTTVGVAMGGLGPVASHAGTTSTTTGINLNCGSLPAAICSAISAAVEGDVRTAFEGVATSTGRDVITPGVQTLLAGFATQDTVVLGPPINDTLNSNAEIEGVFFCGPSVGGLSKPAQCPAASPNPGFGEVHMRTQLFPSGRWAALPSSTFGALRRDEALPPFMLGASDNAAMARADAVLNQALWATWYGGGLSDLLFYPDPAAPATLFSMTMLLPPVIMPGSRGRALDLALGDVQIVITLSGNYVATLYLSSVTGADMVVDATGDAIIFDTEPDPYIAVEVADSLLGPTWNAILVQLTRDFAKGALRDLVNQAFAGAGLPRLPIDSVPGVAAGTTWSLSTITATHPPGYLMANGVLK